MLCMPAYAADEDACGDALKAALRDNDPPTAMKRILDVHNYPACVARLLLLRSNAQVPNSVQVNVIKEATKNIQQTGASVGSGGTTNLVSKNITSRLLSLANEYGAIKESSNGDTTSVSGSLDGIPLALAGRTQDLFTECPLNIKTTKCLSSSTLDFLGRFSYSLAFNTAKASQLSGVPAGLQQGSTQPVTIKSTGTPATVSQITGKFALIPPKLKFNDLEAALKKLPSDSSLVATSADLSAAAARLRSFQENAAQASLQWRIKTAELLRKKSEGEVEAEWAKQGDALAFVLETNGDPKNRPTDAQLTQAALDFADALAKFGSTERIFFNAQLPQPVLSIEYDNNRPPNQPTNSVFRLIYAQTTKGWTFTGNGAISIYDSDPSKSAPGAQRLRDIQLGLEADHDLPNFSLIGKPTFSAAYYFQNQTSPAILNVTPSSPVPGITLTGLSPTASQVFAQKGTISIGQIKFTMGKAASGIKVPFAITFANRTELINKSDVRGQIGISYDFDALFSK